MTCYNSASSDAVNSSKSYSKIKHIKINNAKLRLMIFLILKLLLQ